MKKYQTEFKLKVVKSFLAGESGAKLLAMLNFNTHAFSTEAVSLRWLGVALAALTLPHLVLISLCARLLSAPARGR